MKLISWNVNGIRAAVRHGFADYLRNKKPDVVCLQEIKITHAAREKEQFDFAEYAEYWNPAQRPGYSGTAILVKNVVNKKVIGVANGWGGQEFDSEGRTQVMEFPDFFLVNCYFPNANHELSRLDYKLRYNAGFLKLIKRLEKEKPVISCGDFNVAHRPIDLANPKANEGLAGFTAEERDGMDGFQKAGLVDTYRQLHPDRIQYSWWSYRANVRARNIGWRIDYFLVSKKFAPNVRRSFIEDDIYGSDHCPVGILI